MSLGCVLFGQNLALAGPCEKGAFSDPESFAKGMTEGLSLRAEQHSLFELYKNNFYTHPEKGADRTLKDVFLILENHPDLSKPLLREQILELPLKEKKKNHSLKTFTQSWTRLAGRTRNNLFQIEANLGFWITLLDFATPKTRHPQNHTKALNKESRRALKQKQKEDFIAYLNTTALNEKTRHFIQDHSQSYWERAIVLFKALEGIKEQVGMTTGVIKKIEQAMADLVNTVGFGNESYKALLKNPDPEHSYRALRQMLNERELLAYDLGFEGHWIELKDTLSAKIEDIEPQLKQIRQDIENNPDHLIKKTEILRLRALSLQESPFRSCMGGDCATEREFEKALDPNFLYFTLTDREHRSSGQVTVVLGNALNQEGQTVKVALVDKIQGVPTYRIQAMLEGIRLSLKEIGYALGLPDVVTATFTNDSRIQDFLVSEFLYRQSIHSDFKTFIPYKHGLDFKSQFSGEGDKLDLWELNKWQAFYRNEFQIKSGQIHQPQTASPSLSLQALYAPILSLKDSRKEEEQIRFLDNLWTISPIKEAHHLSDRYVRKHIRSVLEDREFSFQVRKRAFLVLIQFELRKRQQAMWSVLEQVNGFSDTEVINLIGEISDWKNTTGYRRDFINKLNDYSPFDITFRNLVFFPEKHNPPRNLHTLVSFWNRNSSRHLNRFKSFLDSKWSFIVDKNAMLFDIIEKGEVRAGRVLLERGADPNAQNPNGMTALRLAEQAGEVQIVQLLLEKGANH